MRKIFKKLLLLMTVVITAVVFFAFSVSALDDIVIHDRETIEIKIVSNEITYLKFIPTVSGEYRFYSLSDDDTYGYLFDADKNEIENNDDGDEDCNFSITYELEAGVTYYWGARFYCEEQAGSFSVTLEYICSHENITEHNAVDATCAENGYTAGIYCNDCDVWIEGHETVKKLPHTDENDDEICDVCNNPVKVIVASGTCGADSDSVVWSLYDNGELIISGEGKISSYYFSGREDIIFLEIEEGITEIGGGTFSNCENLRSTIISGSVISIGSSAFSNCTNLKDVILGNGLLSIDYYAFRSCTSLTSITIPDSLISIGSSAFCDCTSLASITISDNVNSMSYDVFENTAYYNDASNWVDGVLYLGNHLIGAKGNISGNYTIKNGTKTINGFDNCDGLTSVTIPDSVTMIGLQAFFCCDNLERITIPDSVSYIGAMAFNGTAYFKNENNWDNGVLYVGNHLIYVGNDFSGACKIKEGTKTFAEGAFDDCSKLQSIIIPDSVVSIGRGDPFTWCNSLENISVDEKNEYYSSDEHGVLFDKNKTTLIKYPPAYATISSYNIPGSVTNIDGSAFYCCKLESITIPSSVENVGNSAFWYCSALTNTHYAGTQEQWEKVIIGVNNSFLTDTIHMSTDENNDDVCDLCNVQISNHTHYHTSAITKTPTCTTAGTKTYTCSCGNTYTETISAKGHTEVTVKGRGATCTVTGLTEGKKCSVCGTITVAQKTVDKKPHIYKTTTTKATLTKNGKQATKCTVCGDIKSSKIVYYPKSVKLSTSTYTYNGKTKTPSVVVKDSKGNTLKKDTDYTVKYASGRKNPGKYTVTVTFKGKYSGTKKLTLTIKPKAPSITDIYSKTKGKAVVKWANVTGESGFQLYYASSKDGTYKKVNSYKANKLAGSKTKLKSGKKYYFKVRAYKKTSSGTVYSSWSAVKSVKIK